MTSVLDTFTRADNPSVVGNVEIGTGTWTAHTGTWGIIGNRLYCSAGVVTGFALISVDVGSSDGTFEIPVSTFPGNGWAGLLLRTAGAGSGFAARIDGLYNVSTGTQVGSTFTQTFASGDWMRANLAGTSITIHRQVGGTGPWVQVFSTTSSTYATNTRFGVNIWNTTATTARFDQFTALIPGSSLYMPDVKVEIAFNAGYSTPAGSRTWTDVSQWVELREGIDISYGRADEFGQADPNKLTLTLDNSDGRFTAGKVTGAYYPNVKIGRPIRVTTTLAGVAYPRFVGYVDEWPTGWDGSTSYAHAQITAQSRMARLGFGAELRSTITEEYLSGDPPDYYWPLDEPQGATSAVDLMGGPPLTNHGWGLLAEFGQNMELPGAPETTGAFFVETGSQRLQTILPTPLSTANPNVISIEGFSLPNDNTWIILDQDGSGNTPFLFLLSANDVFQFQYWDGTTTAIAINVATENRAHHLAGQVALSGTGDAVLTLWIDGVPTSTTTPGMTAATGLKYFYIGHHIPPEGMTLAHVAINADMTRVAQRANAGMTGFSGETAGERIERYAGYADVDPAEVVYDSGTNPVHIIDTSGSSVVDAMRRVEETEDGVLFDSRDNTLTLHGRSRRYNTTSDFALDAASQQIETDISPKLDRSTLANDVTATTTADGSSARAIDQNSIDEYGYARHTMEIAGTQDVGYQAATWRVLQYGQPAPRILSLSVDLLPLPPAQQVDLLTADISTRLTISGLPAQAPAPSIDFFIEGYTERIGLASYEFSFNISPTNDDLRTVWVLADPTYGVYADYPLAF